MEKISMDSKLYKFHKFGKSNLVTNIDGTDTYTCEDCGLKGKRFGLDELIELIRPSKEKLSKCNGKKGIFELEIKPKIEKSKKNGFKIKITDDTHLSSFGFTTGNILETVEYPKHQEQGLSGVWVISPEYTEPVRLIENEYEIIEEEL